MIRLYGHLQGSFRTVTLGLKLAFEEFGVLSGYVIGEAQDFDTEPEPGADAPIAVVTGSPLRVWLAHRQGAHKEVWLMLAPNSEGIPPQLRQQLVQIVDGTPLVTGFLAPSTWAQEVLKREFPEHEVKLCQHGVLPTFYPVENSQHSSKTVLHVTSTETSRKSTKPLLRAWKTYRENGGALQLLVMCNPEYLGQVNYYAASLGLGMDEVRFLSGQNLEYDMWAAVYRGVRYVIQPSRAEGFGLVPLESLSCGTPVALTNCTGHGEYLPTPGVLEIAHRSLGESDDFWGSRAPVVKEEDILEALLHLEQEEEYSRLFSEAQGGAAELAAKWTWKRGAALVVAEWSERYG